MARWRVMTGCPGASRRARRLVDGGDLPLASRSAGIAEVIGLEWAHGRDRDPAGAARRQQHLEMGRGRRRSAFLLRRIETDQRQRDGPDLADRRPGVAGRPRARRFGEGEIPFDRLVDGVDLAARLVERLVVGDLSGDRTAYEIAGVVRDVEARVLGE